jgi:hypothetical protein
VFGIIFEFAAFLLIGFGIGFVAYSNGFGSATSAKDKIEGNCTFRSDDRSFPDIQKIWQIKPL